MFDKKRRKKKMKYIAYGSNMSVEQMAHRCPGATIVGTGKIEGYNLLFRGRPYSAVATVERGRKNAQVPVLVWEIDKFHERALDIYEGFPTLYTKVNIPVQMDNGEYLETAMAYVIDPTLEYGAPSEYYFSVLRDAYLDLGFNMEILKWAVRKSTKNSEWRRR